MEFKDREALRLIRNRKKVAMFVAYTGEKLVLVDRSELAGDDQELFIKYTLNTAGNITSTTAYMDAKQARRDFWEAVEKMLEP